MDTGKSKALLATEELDTNMVAGVTEDLNNGGCGDETHTEGTQVLTESYRYKNNLANFIRIQNHRRDRFMTRSRDKSIKK